MSGSHAVQRVVLLAGALWVLGVVGGATTQAQTPPGERPPGSQQADLHNPFSPHYQRYTPDSYPHAPSTTPGGSHTVITVPSWGWGSWWPAYGVPYGPGVYYGAWPYAPGYGGGVYYGAPYGGYSYESGYFGSGYGPWGRRSMRYGVITYGPGVVIDPGVGGIEPGVVIPEDPSDAEDVAPAEPEVREFPRERRANATAVATAWKYLRYGDVHFSKQHFRDALKRYQDAIRQADLPEAHVRAGQVYVAQGKLHEAAQAFRRALERDPNWPLKPERLDTLYGDDQALRAQHAEAVFQASDARPENADAAFTAGVLLYFAGQPQRAKTYFERVQAVQVSAAHAEAFLSAIAERQRSDAPGPADELPDDMPEDALRGSGT